MFSQTDAIRDYIFPIVVIEGKDSNISIKQVLGTGFLIGAQGFSLTARHVIDKSDKERLAAIFADQSNKWRAFEITHREMHTSEDVALVKLW